MKYDNLTILSHPNWEWEEYQTPYSGGDVVSSASVCGGEVVYKSSFSGGGVVCPDPSSCGPDQSYDEGDETGQGEPMSQSPPQSSGRGSEETDSILCDEREEVCSATPYEKKRKKPKDHIKGGR